MSDKFNQAHPNLPKNQPFNVGARKNLYKKRAWWQLGNNNNGKKSK